MLGIILFLNSLGGGELILIMLVILLFFGSNKIPELARGLGRGMREFKDAANGIQREIEESAKDIKKDVDIQKTLDQIIEDEDIKQNSNSTEIKNTDNGKN
jgi:sec-independent protein translocase protein TatA